MSLRTRLTLYYTLVLAAVLVLFGLAVYGLISIVQLRQVDSALERAARDLLFVARVDEQGDIIFIQRVSFDSSVISQVWNTSGQFGGEFHVIKNTLGRRAFKAAGYDVPAADLLGSTAIGLAFSDAPGVAKALADFAKEQEAVKIKSGFLGKDYLSKQDVTRLATLPALPVVRSQFLALLNTPATQLVRLLNEPGRRVAQVIKANAEKATA